MQVSKKVTAQIDHLNITVTLEFFFKFDIFSIDQSPDIAGKLNNHAPCLFVGGSSYIPK